MKPRTTTILRRVMLALLLIPVAWLVLWATGAATLVRREVLQVGKAQGVTVTCRYAHALGTYEVIDFTTDPDAIACARFLSVRSTPPARASRWTAPLPTDRTVQIECRFLRYPVDGDGGLGTRFTAESPLRLAVNFGAGQFTLANADERNALGDPKTDTPTRPSFIRVEFQRGTTPILSGEKPGRLALSIFSRDGRAAMFLLPSKGPLLWTREGGCRPTS